MASKNEINQSIIKRIFQVLTLYFIYRFLLIGTLVILGLFNYGPLAETIFRQDFGGYTKFLGQILLYLLIIIGLWHQRFWGLILGLIVTLISLVALLGAAIYNGIEVLSIGDYLWGIVSIFIVAAIVILVNYKKDEKKLSNILFVL